MWILLNVELKFDFYSLVALQVHAFGILNSAICVSFQSIFSKMKDSFKDIMYPSWLSGSGKNEDSGQQKTQPVEVRLLEILDSPCRLCFSTYNISSSYHESEQEIQCLNPFPHIDTF